MEIIKHDLGVNVEEIKIIPIGDPHIGSEECDLTLLNKTIQRIKDEPNTYTILMGDIIENSIIQSVGDVYNQVMTPEAQIDYAVKVFEPIKDKILYAVQGNHSNRSKKAVDIDPMKIIMGYLGKLDVYTRDGAVLFVSFGKNKGRENVRHTATLYPVHGSRGGGRSASFNHVADLAKIVDCDIYLHAHTHKPGAFKTSYYKTDSRYKTVYATEKLFINTAAFLNYGGYGQRATYTPTSKTMPEISIWYERFDKQEIVQFRSNV